MILRLVAAFVFAASAAAASGQAMAVGGPAASNPILRTGTDVPLQTIRELTTRGKTLRPGDRFDLEVSEAVKLNGQIVIPAGARAVGEITAIRNKGMWGKSGNIDARALYVIANDRQIRLSGTISDKGKAGGTGAVAVSALVFLPAGFFMTGTSAFLPAGSQMVARIDEDVAVAFVGDATPSPMTVVASASRTPSQAPPAIAPAAQTAVALKED